MSLLRRIDKSPRILRKLLEKMTQSDDFKSRMNEMVDGILTEENITLSDQDRQKLREQPVDYLLNRTSPQPTSPEQEDAMLQARRAARQARPQTMADIDPKMSGELKSRISAKLLNDDQMETMQTDDQRREHVAKLVDEVFSELDIKGSRAEHQRLVENVIAEVLGFGPLDKLLRDDMVTDILVLGPKNIYMTCKGARQKASETFENNEHVLRILDRIVAPFGQRIDENEPMISMRLQDGSRIEAVISPIAANGPSLTIYKYNRKLLTAEDLVRFSSLSNDALFFLKACVQTGMNILVSGTEAVGKTTILNILGGFISESGLTVTIEDVSELSLPQPEVLRLETRSANIEGKGKISPADLVRQAIRMHAEHIIVGETHGEEAFELAQSGRMWMTTARSSSIEDTLAFLQTLSNSKNNPISSKALHNTLADSVDLVVHIERLKDGSRKVTRIAEIVKQVGMDYMINDLFSFDYQGDDKYGRVIGRFLRTYQKPSEKFLERLTDFTVDKALQGQVLQLFNSYAPNTD